LPLSFAVLRDDGSVTLFVDRRKLAPGLDRHLGNGVTIEAPDRLGPALDELAASGVRVQVDPATAASWVFDRLGKVGARIHRAADPCLLRKPAKTKRSSMGPAPRIAAMVRRLRDFWPGWHRKRQKASCVRSPPATGSKPSAARASISAT